MTRVVTEATLDQGGAPAALEERDGVVLESAVGPGRFTAAEGPVDSYRRSVVWHPLPDGRTRVRQTVEFELAVPWVGWLFVLPMRHHLGRIGPTTRLPWWLPPARIDARAARTLTVLCALALLTGYLGTVLTQTVTFAGREFGSGTAAQGWALSVVRADVVVSLVLVAVADRRGRRTMLIASTAAGGILTALGALAPSLAVLAVTQVLARGFVTASVILLYVVSAEEVAAGARAWAVSVLALTAALGAGACVALVPIAGIAVGAWRVLYAVGLVVTALALLAGRQLQESRRFARRAARALARAGRASHRARLWLLASSSFLLAAFAIPASQYLNQYLRTERGFSASRIAAFVLLTSTPGGIGVVLGGRLADAWGRRMVAVGALLAGAGATVAYFLNGGWGMWAWAVAASVTGAAAIPALAVYGPELFPTALRGKANGAIFATNRLGSAAGLVAVGQLSGPLGGIGEPLAVLAVCPLAVAVLVLAAYPETAGVELEALNPADAEDPDDGGPGGPGPPG